MYDCLIVASRYLCSYCMAHFRVSNRFEKIEKIGNFTDKYVTLVVSDEPVLSHLILISNLILTVKQISNVPTLCSRQEMDINN